MKLRTPPRSTYLPLASQVGIQVMTFEDFAGVMECVRDGTFASTVWSEEQSDRANFDSDPLADALEVLDADTGGQYQCYE
jgi:hypothetical protein